MTPFLVTVGGFLGAGKTTLIFAASRLLQQVGHKVAVILNDQGADLVDTAHALEQGLAASEIAGGCFCCRFSQLLSVADAMRALHPDVIFLEPVGSCTDLAATVLRPLMEEAAGRYVVAPMTVLVDPERYSRASEASIRFLLTKQMAEADLVVFSKSDLHAELPSVPGPMVRSISALTGAGVQAWLDEVLSGSLPIASKILAIDYAEYARAEAALGWLNWTGSVQLEAPLSPAQLLGPWIDDLQARLRGAQVALAHLKILDGAEGEWLKVAATSTQTDPIVEGTLTASPRRVHSIRINMRAVMTPQDMEILFREALAELPGEQTAVAFQCFSPAAPVPERRVSGLQAETS